MLHLKRQLHFWDSVAITVGIVIGVGIFRTPGVVAKYIDSPSLILLAWLFGGLISLFGVLCYAELSSRFPQTGGTYIFLREAYGKFIGFLYGWAEFSINRAATIAAVAYIFAAYFRHLTPFAAWTDKWIAFTLIFFFTWINILGIHFSLKIQNLLSSFKVIAILAISGLIFFFIQPNAAASFNFRFSGIEFHRISGFAPALVAILWTYGGWHESTFMSGEFKDTKRELPLALITSAFTVIGLYVLINAAYLYVILPSEMAASKTIASDALTRLFGPNGKWIVTIAILCSALGALNSNILTGARVPFSIAGDFPKLAWFGQVNPRYQTPLRSYLANGIWAAILVLWGNFEQILFFNAFEIWFFFTLAGVSVFIFRGRSSSGQSFKMIGYPFVPILFTLVAGWLCWSTIKSAPREAFFGTLVILAGIPIYFLAKMKPKSS